MTVPVSELVVEADVLSKVWPSAGKDVVLASDSVVPATNTDRRKLLKATIITERASGSGTPSS